MYSGESTISWKGRQPKRENANVLFCQIFQKTERKRGKLDRRGGGGRGASKFLPCRSAIDV